MLLSGATRVFNFVLIPLNHVNRVSNSKVQVRLLYYHFYARFPIKITFRILVISFSGVTPANFLKVIFSER